ncbi:hypothetical protein NPX13_g8979 [Xylaria arbuscula]|uniref:Uncharacterized protein n=1 Tax=Xylaria arbuscula TaxID=114810 RepID=A0A9W8N7I6_9PEZI|nr:hypothetical protein NPX13_g8979 [Xylaria arbuscula]
MPHEWPLYRYYGADKLWHSYFMYLVRTKPDPSFLRLAELYQVAQTYCQQSGCGMRETLDALCWLGLKTSTTFYRYSYSWMARKHPKNRNTGNGVDDSKLRLLCVAAYLNDIGLAEELLLEGVRPFMTCDLFDSPINLAALAGHATMLKMLQEHMPDIEELEVSGYVLFAIFNRRFYHWRGREHPGAILGAAEGGDLGILRIALDVPKHKDKPSSSYFEDNMSSGGVNPCGHDPLSCALAWAQSCTNSIEVYDYLDSVWANSKRNPSDFLAWYCRRGNIGMIRHLLDKGADMRASYSGRGTGPMAEACWAGHEDVVDLLLERGADPNYRASNDCSIADAPLTAAAAGGHLNIVRKLLDHGAVVSLQALSKAFMVEHTGMVQLLLQNCPSFPMDWKHYIVRDLLKAGLESMVKLIPVRGMMGWLIIHNQLQNPISPALLDFARQLEDECSST